MDAKLAEEVAGWLARFALLSTNPHPRVADIGAKNFFLAPALDRLLRARGLDPEIHGIEIDAFRRYRNLWTREDYGRLYANSIAYGVFHAMDFHQWTQPLDLALLLNPFVSEGPLRAWGLPESCFRPLDLFAHTHTLLKPQNGMLILCSPSESELEIAGSLAKEVGFVFRERKDWQPLRNSLQQRPRLGMAFGT